MYLAILYIIVKKNEKYILNNKCLVYIIIRMEEYYVRFRGRSLNSLSKSIILGDIKKDKNLDQSSKNELINDLLSNFLPSCDHYPTKKCSQFQYNCCGITVPCHRCHNEFMQHKPLINTITCIECNTKQSTAIECINCNIKFSKSYCEICGIWTDKLIYHCNECGICRVGKIEDSFHCKNCEGCFHKSSKDFHKCSKKQLKDLECPICMDSLHNSQENTFIPNCGHPIHLKCLKDNLSKGNYECPTCKKSIIDMKQTWDALRETNKTQIIPHALELFQRETDIVDKVVYTPFGLFRVSNYRAKDSMYEGKFIYLNTAYGVFNKNSIKELYSHILCNDCERKSYTKFHIYEECTLCGSFNTQKV
jgi:hypothetical protein